MEQLIIFFAGMVSGMTSFGFALISVPLLTLSLQTTASVPLVVFLSNISRAYLVWQTRKIIKFNKLYVLLIGGIAGVIIGTIFYTFLNANNGLKIFIGVTSILSALLLFVGYRNPLPNTNKVFFPVGFISGFLQGSTGMGGPPIIIFLSNQKVPKNLFRANANLFFMILTILVVVGQIITGVITYEIIIQALKLIPALLLGTNVGSKIASLIDEKLFHKFLLLLVAISGVLVIIQAI